MLKNWIIFFVVFISSVEGYSMESYKNYPDYDLVVRKFFNEYEVTNIEGITEGNTEVSFMKKPAGWFVTIIDPYEENKILKEELFWDSRIEKFKKIDFNKLSNINNNEGYLEKYLSSSTKYHYRICPYFGYPGWDWDVIEDYKNEPNLPDSILYGLARAYSSFASNLLHNNSGYSAIKHRFVLPSGQNSLTADELAKYRFYRHQAIATYQKLEKLNPNFKTIVGKIGIKLSNEYLTSFLDLRIYQNEEEAAKEIKPGLYNDYLIAYAKNYLNSCSTNAILFTNGDNDTYPLLYVQAQYSFRTDVLVVNLSLLQTDSYINSFRQKLFQAMPLPLSLNPSAIKGKKREYIYILNEDSLPIELSSLIKFILNDKNMAESQSGSHYFYSPTKKFMLSAGNEKILWEFKQPYLFRNSLIVMDILANNNFSRPIYFGITVGDEGYQGLDNYLKLEGLVYRLSPTKKQVDDDEFGEINTANMYESFINKFDFSGVDSSSDLDFLTSQNYRNNFSKLALKLIDESKFDSAKVVLDKCVAFLPDNKHHFDYYMLPIIEAYYKIKEFEKGNLIAEQLLTNVNSNVKINGIVKPEINSETKKQLKELTAKFNQINLSDKIIDY